MFKKGSEAVFTSASFFTSSYFFCFLVIIYWIVRGKNMKNLLLPKKLVTTTKISFIHTSSPIDKPDLPKYKRVTDQFSMNFPYTKIFNIHESKNQPNYLSGSEKERLSNFRKAIQQGEWLLPVYGGTGCEDIIRHLNDHDLYLIRKNRPIVNGFSDTTFLINYLYFKIGLLTFQYRNALGIFEDPNHKLFFEILRGQKDSMLFYQPGYKWLSDPKPEKPIEGIAIGGNISTFRDLLDICEIKPRSWEPYILFIEDIGMDEEDLHRVIIALDERGLFKHIRALVVGEFREKIFKNSIFSRFLWSSKTNTDNVDNLFEYILSDVIAKRSDNNDPLNILRVTNLGHHKHANPMIIPIGAPTTIYPNGHIEFHGPFVE